MNQNSVFEFNEHFDGEFLHAIYENNVAYAKDLFEIYYKTTPTTLTKIHAGMASADWESARSLIHEFRKNVAMVGLTKHSEKLYQIEKQLFHVLTPQANNPTPDTSSIVADFHHIQTALLANLSLIRAEVDRMSVYLSHPQRHL